MRITPFGIIDINKLEEYYDAEIKVDDSLVEVDLNFESESVAKELIVGVEKSISNLKIVIEKAMSAISDDFDKGDDSETAMFYLKHHLDELSSEEIKKVFGTTNVTKEIFMKSIHVRRIGFYPEDEDSFIVVDVMLPEEYTNYTMAVTFNNAGEFLTISMES